MVEPVYTEWYKKTWKLLQKQRNNIKKLQEKLTKILAFYDKKQKLTNEIISSNVFKAI